MSGTLPPAILKARLNVVLALNTFGGISAAMGDWIETEDFDTTRMAELLVEAILQAVGDGATMALAIYASAALRDELVEVRDGCL